MNLTQDELFFPVLCNRITALAKEFDMNAVEICAAWRGDDGDYSDSRSITLRNDDVVASLRAFENAIVNSAEYCQPIKTALLSQMEQAVKNLSIQVCVDVHLPDPGPDEEQQWF